MTVITTPMLILLSLLMIHSLANKNSDKIAKRKEMLLAESGCDAFMEMKYIDGFDKLKRETQVSVIFYEDKLLIDKFKFPIDKIKYMDVRFGNQMEGKQYNIIKELKNKDLLKKPLGARPGDKNINSLYRRPEDVILFTISYQGENGRENMGIFVFDEEMLINKCFGIKLTNLSEAVAFLTYKNNLETTSNIIEEKKGTIPEGRKAANANSLYKFIRG